MMRVYCHCVHASKDTTLSFRDLRVAKQTTPVVPVYSDFIQVLVVLRVLSRRWLDIFFTVLKMFHLSSETLLQPHTRARYSILCWSSSELGHLYRTQAWDKNGTWTADLDWFLAKGEQAHKLSSFNPPEQQLHQQVQIPSSNLHGCSRRTETCCESFQFLMKALQLCTN